MNHRMFTLFGLIAAFSFILLFVGPKDIFAQGPSRLEKNWGKSYHAAKYNQILNHDGRKNLDPVVGLDGKASEENIGNYRKDFKKETPQTIYNLDLGVGTVTK